MITISNCWRCAGGHILINPKAVRGCDYFEVTLFEGRTFGDITLILVADFE